MDNNTNNNSKNTNKNSSKCAHRCSMRRAAQKTLVCKKGNRAALSLWVGWAELDFLTFVLTGGVK